jgi:pimeloyl-ACP methyl ester carboxylesterase
MVGRVRRFVVRALLVYLLLSAVAGVLLAEFALHPGRIRWRPDATARATAMAREHQARLERARITAADGVPLEGWRFVRERPSRGTVLVAHGLSGNRNHALRYAEFLLDAGYDVLAPDARGHGESGGMRCGSATRSPGSPLRCCSSTAAPT